MSTQSLDLTNDFFVKSTQINIIIDFLSVHEELIGSEDFFFKANSTDCITKKCIELILTKVTCMIQRVSLCICGDKNEGSKSFKNVKCINTSESMENNKKNIFRKKFRNNSAKEHLFTFPSYILARISCYDVGTFSPKEK